jgi:hypothetical protein
MGRRLDPIRAFDSLGDEETRLSGGQLALKRAVEAAESALKAAGQDSVTAEAELMRGHPDRTGQAGQAEQAARDAVATAARRVTACEEAIAAVRIERGRLVADHRDDVFLPAARDADNAVRAAAGECLTALNQLQSAARDAATAVNRLRPRDRAYGGFIGGSGTRLRFDAAVVAQWLTVAGERGVQWSSDVDPDTGMPVSRQVLLEARMAGRA